jgi:AcrR family transcriptional regulator
MKDRILDSVRQNALKYGFKGFTIENICTDLKISKKTIYKYFNSKDEMISCVVDFHIEMDKANTLKNVEEKRSLLEKLESAILCYYEYTIPLTLVDEIKKNFPEQWLKVENLLGFKQELFRDLVNQGIAGGSIKGDVSLDILMLTIQNTIPAIIDYKFLASHDQCSATANEMLKDFCRLILDGIAV